MPTALCLVAATAALAATVRASDDDLEPSSPLIEDQTVVIVLVSFLILLSGLFSGLTLGLMSLDTMDLEILQDSGDPIDRVRAAKIATVRKNGNFLLCTLLLGNVGVNSLLSILLADLTTGLLGLALSTGLIVVFGEIIPQALCSRYPLAIGASTVWMVKLIMLLTFVISWPVSKVLDIVLGEELRDTYSRGELKKLVDIHAEAVSGKGTITKEERLIICGALDLMTKTVADAMIPIEDVYMVEAGDALSEDRLEELLRSGHSRLPVYEGTRTNVKGLICVKDLVLISPKDNVPVREVMEKSGRKLQHVRDDVTLENMLRNFRQGTKGHMALVRKEVVTHVDEYDFPERSNVVVGIITLEDLVEEILQAEIEDETDKVFYDGDSNSNHSSTGDNGANDKVNESEPLLKPPKDALGPSPAVRMFRAKQTYASTNTLPIDIKEVRRASMTNVASSAPSGASPKPARTGPGLRSVASEYGTLSDNKR